MGFHWVVDEISKKLIDLYDRVVNHLVEYMLKYLL